MNMISKLRMIAMVLLTPLIFVLWFILLITRIIRRLLYLIIYAWADEIDIITGDEI